MTPRPRVHALARRSVVAAVLLAGVSLVPASCAEPEDSSLCTRFDQLVVSGEALTTAIDGDTAGELKDDAENLLQHVTALQDVADGRYSAELDSLEQTLDDLVRTLGSIQEDAEYDTWAPLVEDSVEDVETAGARLVESIEPSCESNATVTTTT